MTELKIGPGIDSRSGSHGASRSTTNPTCLNWLAQHSFRSGLDPSTESGPDGSDDVRCILGAVTTIANGLAELRNRGLGTGRGPASARGGLGSRHAHLAVNAALTWCQLMLDTLADPEAPWRKGHS